MTDPLNAHLGSTVAVIVARDGQLPGGAREATAEAGGRAVVVGTGAQAAAMKLDTAVQTWWAPTGTGPGTLAAGLSTLLRRVGLVVLPASADGRDLAPRLAAELGRPLLAGCVRVALESRGASFPGVTPGTVPLVRAGLARLDDRLDIAVRVRAPAVATLLIGVRAAEPVPDRQEPQRLDLPLPDGVPDPEVLDVLRPPPQALELAEAERIVGAGAGLIPPGTDDATARAAFDLTGRVAARFAASAGATRVLTDAGWAPHERQIGTTGVFVRPELYLALGISGATQHTGGLGEPRHVISVNADPACPMTAMADLGLVTDAPALLAELARRLGIDVGSEVAGG